MSGEKSVGDPQDCHSAGMRRALGFGIVPGDDGA